MISSFNSSEFFDFGLSSILHPIIEELEAMIPKGIAKPNIRLIFLLFILFSPFNLCLSIIKNYGT
ncbi:Hypothetical protein MCYN_0700 [Mycoplasmopsis cynos C142]|uniref:Uncharacterized protein n=1 Tax=Mycoplasmopsis cynos (strain C142) TaxID=1246955 RepID=L0RWB4_MYCC1|nr:Hypothetical protein MCYN_0700 [Mycoplasmopsis cynos C142]